MLREAQAMAQIAGLPDALARLMAARGVTLERMNQFLEPRLRDLMPDPDALTDMARAVATLVEAIEKRERIAIFGDYDVDGACSAALLGSYLRALDVPFEIYIPDRIFEGYGPNVDAVRQLAKAGARLLVTVDCGSTSFAPLAEARRLGLKVVVLDHHQVGDALPETGGFVNPNRQDDLSGLNNLCAAGVVFVTLVALNRQLRGKAAFVSRAEPNLLSALDLVALATVADVVPLQGLNRAFVRQGLKIMRTRQRPGLSALMDVAQLNRPVEPYHLGFLLGPRINAGGRIGNAALGAKLLMSADPAECASIAAELERLNRERQAAEQIMVEEAIAQAEAEIGLDQPAVERSIIVTGSDAWHPGIVGLVASRLKERFGRPAFAFAFSGEGGSVTGAGSGRSVPGVDLGSAVRAAVETGLLVKGGGHAMAAGATIDPSRIAEFQDFLQHRLSVQVEAACKGDALLIDALLTIPGATATLVADCGKAEPFGQGNPEPVFAFADVRLVECLEVGSGGHLRLKLKSGEGVLNAVAFRAAGQPLGHFLREHLDRLIHVAGTLSLDHYGGREKMSLRVLDAASG